MCVVDGGRKIAVRLNYITGDYLVKLPADSFQREKKITNAPPVTESNWIQSANEKDLLREMLCLEDRLSV